MGGLIIFLIAFAPIVLAAGILADALISRRFRFREKHRLANLTKIYFDEQEKAVQTELEIENQFYTLREKMLAEALKSKSK